VDRVLHRLLDKLERNRELIDKFEMLSCEDADILIVTCGITSRAARRAVKLGREEGIKVGLFRPITLWPFPEKQFVQVAGAARHVLVPEMNAGQLCMEIERLCPPTKVTRMNRINGESFTPHEILDRARALAIAL
jgi:2-oxoglutarate ferredoxin oxidoreductase subunit alpha